MTLRPCIAALVLAAAALPAPAGAMTSSELDALWDFARPGSSEQRFRAERERWPAASREALEIDTQIARTQGLQRRYAEAHATLDKVAGALASAPPRLEVRYRLERGRVFNSSGAPEVATTWFVDALKRADDDREPGADYYRVDALHMLGIAAPAADRLAWNERALAAAEASSDARARGWRASLLNNLGWTLFDAGDAQAALGYWERALAAGEATGDPARVRIARWTVARGLRADGRLDAAEGIQRALAAELDAAGERDGYVYEELAEIALARGDATGAASWAALAYAELARDPGLAQSEPARLARLKQVAGSAAR